MDKTSKRHVETIATHAAADPAAFHGAVNTPVYHASTIVYPTYQSFRDRGAHKLEKGAMSYGRVGTPTSVAFETAVAELEGGWGAITTSSGLSAITTALLAFVHSGDHILVADSAYRPTRDFCEHLLRDMNVTTEFYDPLIGSDIESLIRPQTRLIYLESPGSLSFEIQDVPAITEVAKAKEIVTLIDNTWGTPVNFPAFQHGVNVSIHAATKYIVGHSDAMLGVIVTDENHFQTIRKTSIMLGQCAGPDDIYLGMRGLRTLPVRLKQHESNGIAMANWLNNQPAIAEVFHPALPSSPGHRLWQRDFRGACGLFSVLTHPCSEDAMAHFIESLALFSIGASWGGYESLVLPADPSSFRSAVKWEREGWLIRFHAGLEHIDDLIADLEAAIHHLA